MTFREIDAVFRAHRDRQMDEHRGRAWMVAHLVCMLGQFKRGQQPKVKHLYRDLVGEPRKRVDPNQQREEWQRQLREMGYDEHGNYTGRRREVSG